MGELKRFGRYEVVRVLGSGAMGVVYEGIDTKLDRRVAIKTIHKDALLDPGQAADYHGRFMREAQAVARLNHPNIVTVYDFGEEDDTAYLVMEFIQGRELKEFFDGGMEFPLPQSMNLMTELLEALDYAHSQGIVHRDIKPANVMIDQAGRLKLMDFGVVKVLDSTEGTQAGTIVGTPSYMSPEQIQGKAAGPGADIFAAGIILYQFLTGQRPFTGDGTFVIQQKIVNEKHAPPSSLNRNLPPSIDRVIDRALAKEPGQRYARAREFAMDIRQFLSMDAAQVAPAASRQADEKTVVISHAEPPAQPAGSGGNPEAATPAARGDDTLRQARSGDSTNIMCSVLFLDIVAYSKVPNLEQISLKKRFNALLSAAIEGISPDDLVILDTGDGAALNFLGDVGDAILVALRLRDSLCEEESQTTGPQLLVRMGINLGPGHLTKDINGRPNIVGDVINAAQRVMGFSEPGQILVSRSYFDAISHLTHEYAETFHSVGARADKHGREHEVYEFGERRSTPATAAQASLSAGAPVRSNHGTGQTAADTGNQAGEAAGARGRKVSPLGHILRFLKSLFNSVVGVLRLAIVIIVIIFAVTLAPKIQTYAPTAAALLQERWENFRQAVLQRLDSGSAAAEADSKSKKDSENNPKTRGPGRSKINSNGK